MFCLEEKLDNKSEIVSTKVLNVKVCENAKRDMKIQEKQKERKLPQRKIPQIVVQNKTEAGQYWVMASSKRNYEALLAVGAVMEGNAGGDVEAWRREVDTFNRKKTRVELDGEDSCVG